MLSPSLVGTDNAHWHYRLLTVIQFLMNTCPCYCSQLVEPFSKAGNWHHLDDIELSDWYSFCACRRADLDVNCILGTLHLPILHDLIIWAALSSCCSWQTTATCLSSVSRVCVGLEICGKLLQKCIFNGSTMRIACVRQTILKENMQEKVPNGWNQTPSNVEWKN